MKILILLTILTTSAYGFIDPMEDVALAVLTSDADDEKISKKVVAAYCIDQNGTAPETLKEVKFTSEVNCKFGRSSLFFYEAWNSKNTSLDLTDLKMSSLEPKLKEEEKNYFYISIAIQLIKGPDCKIEVKGEPAIVFRSCPTINNGKAEDITGLIAAKVKEPGFEDIVATRINNHGKASFQSVYGKDKKPDVHSVVPEVKNDVVDPKPAVVTDEKVVVNDPPRPKDQDKVITEPNTVVVKADEKDEVIDVVEKDTRPDPDCNEELRQEIAALLALDENNIIGLQFELTVLKMAALATESKTNSIEGVIRKQSKRIDAIDDGIINKMNVMYKKHGLKEDAAKISTQLKLKSSSANYFARDKRFFNQDSSAFLLAYQGMNENSGIKDSDVSVLWFMDKVSEKAKDKSGIYSEAHNLTNLSTRLAQYTSAISKKNALSKPVLDEMVRKQNLKIEKEFLDLIQRFKTSNPVCYASLFSDSEEDIKCNLNLVEERFSLLLAVNSQIKSTDLISIDSKFKGGIENARFSLKKYVDAPEKVKEVRTSPTITNEHRTEAKETAPKADQSEPVKEEEPPSTPDQFKTLNFTEE